jgi:hypothetical protein
MTYNTRDYWVFGLCPSSGIQKNTKEHNISFFRIPDDGQRPSNPEYSWKVGIISSSCHAVIWICHRSNATSSLLAFPCIFSVSLRENLG